MADHISHVEKFDYDKTGISVTFETVSAEHISESKEQNVSTGETPCTQEGQDEALDILASEGKNLRLPTPEEDAHLVRKIDRHLMPIMFCIYFLQLMDKQALSFASVFGLSQDTNLQGDEYSLLGSIVYIAQLGMQPLSAYLLVKLRLSVYIPLVVTCWGISVACTGVARNFTGLLCARFFLGAFESSIQASFILIVQMWYRRREQGFRLAIWYSTAGWINIFGSLVIYGLGHIQSRVLHTYQIIFLGLGSTTVSVGLLSFLIFPDNAVRCKFLTPDEKIMAIERLRANQQGLETKAFKVRQLLEMLSDVKSWCWMCITFTMAIPGTGIATFGPLIMGGFGFDGYKIMLLMIPLGCLQVFGIFGGFWLSRRYSLKSPIIFGLLLLCVASSLVLLKTGRSIQEQPLLVVAYYTLHCASSVATPMVVNWQSSNVAGHSKKSTTTGFMLMGSFTGSIIGPLLFTTKDSPNYHKGVVSMLVCFSTSSFLVLFTAAYLRHLNAMNRKRRVFRGKVGKIVDYSMLSTANAEKRRMEENESSGGVVVTGVGAFDDLTDLDNDQFIVSTCSRWHPCRLTQLTYKLNSTCIDLPTGVTGP
ncbi:hypothetical protein GALMADRAFT_63756 [Galerina marginata CBS 339.88]|uniref:Major facilitator superfamily (MFS) profile domain-containing protein n=1 Tax=Galerina marginata (strain CBS 339.88) TaxID=685588 RepID=A0A067T8K7_GALM3|nr:hypothetical protein GALMADRAFT_63756 [Galerina marginata CBS 339.88]